MELLASFVQVSLALLALTQLVSSDAGPTSCHLREFDICMASAVVFVQNPPTGGHTVESTNKQCELFADTEKCIEKFEEACMSPMQNSLVDFMSGGVLQNMREYCKPSSALRKKYIEHSDCVSKQRSKTKQCLIDFQAAIEKSTTDTTHWRERPKVLCWYVT